jgi:hypothetical protein
MKSVLLAAACAVAIIAVVELGFRATGGTPSISLGKTPVEFQWKLKHADAQRLIYVVGDSRVEWGFGDHLFNEELSRRGVGDTVALNAGYPASSAAAVVEYIVSTHKGLPGVLVINYSACSFYRWVVSPGQPMANLKLQDLLDDRIRCRLKEAFYTYDRERHVYTDHLKASLNGGAERDVVWYRRDQYPEGFMQLRGRWNDGSPFDIRDWSLSSYRKQLGLLRKEEEKYTRRRKEIIETVVRARQAGWDVLLMRIPIGSRQFQMEQALPEHLLLEAVAADMAVPVLDYQDDPRLQPIETYDESHLAPRSARVMARVLAQDFADYFAGRQPAAMTHPSSAEMARGKP